MDIKAARRVSVRTQRSAFDRLGEGQYVKNQVCVYWLQGRCNRNPCRYMHRESPPPQPKQSRQASSDDRRVKSTWTNPNSYGPKKVIVSTNGGPKAKSVGKDVQQPQQKVLTTGGAASREQTLQKVQQKLCQYWVTDNCVHGDKCKDLHSWFCGSGFSMLTMLEGHSKAITGIALPSGSDKLYSGSKDGSVRLWDCNSGQCTGAVKLDCEVGCLIVEGPWLFVGLQNAVKAWNLQTQTELILNGPVGQVRSMVVGNDMLFAGIEGGTILAWRFSSEMSCPELVASLKGHIDDVVTLTVTLTVGTNRLYSGSKDNTIRVWDLESLQCLETLHGHSSAVTSVLCWDKYLLSGSLDNTLKVWAATESGNLEVVCELKEESGILAFCGIHDAEAKPILLCSCKDNSVRLYDLPSFAERGRIFAKRDVHSIQIGCGGLFFTGDETGRLSVWKLLGASTAVPS